MENDTIAAISTALGVGAISIIRISGPDAINIASKIFRGKDLKNVPSHTIHYGKISDEKEIIDEVLVTVMKAPKTFTKEDIVEINCHGGILVTKQILQLILDQGARLAEPGEFTKRAFLNNRIDLIEAEGIMEMLNAKNNQARKLAIQSMDGSISKYIKELRVPVEKILTNIEVNIDYPEYEDIEEVTIESIKTMIHHLEVELDKILKDEKTGQLIKEGIKTIIIGRPNVGKSSLLNALLKEEKAIVTPIAGTTRDIVEGQVQIGEVTLNLIDTAGIRTTQDEIEKIGVEKSKKQIETADLILTVLDNSEELTEEDKELLALTNTKNNIIVVNKKDLPTKIDLKGYETRNTVTISTKDEESLYSLKSMIQILFELEQIKEKDFNYIVNTRSLSIIKEAMEIIKDIKNGLDQNVSIDMLEIDIKRLWEKLGEITGETYQEELLDKLFENFCVGK